MIDAETDVVEDEFGAGIEVAVGMRGVGVGFSKLYKLQPDSRLAATVETKPNAAMRLIFNLIRSIFFTVVFIIRLRLPCASAHMKHSDPDAPAHL